MAKKQIRLNESQLRDLIRETVANFIKENIDEISPEFLIHASHAADAEGQPSEGFRRRSCKQNEPGDG